MKLLTPWFCLAAVTAAHSSAAYASHGVHRFGHAESKHNANLSADVNRSCIGKDCTQGQKRDGSDMSAGVEDYRQGKYVKALQQLSKQNKYNAVESYYLGKMNLYGYGQLKNNAKALRFYSQAAEGGFLPAQQVMALYMLLEKKDPVAAFYWFKKSADANDVQAQMYVAAAYLYGFGVKKNEDKARQYYIGAARQGNSIAQYAVAEYFLDSRQAANKKLGMIWLDKAIVQHNPKAQLMMSKLCLEGKILPKSMEKANQWLDLAITQGNAQAMIKKGDMARAQRDFHLAKDWYVKAADLGYLPAEFVLGQLYLDKTTSLYDPKLGYLWILKASQNDLAEAQLVLADLYKTGTGVEANGELAKEWQDKARNNHSLLPEVQVAKWLSNGKSTDFAASGYHLKGIFTDWANAEAQKQNSYNPAPHMVPVTRDMLYKPNFLLAAPNDIPISDYYDALASALGGQDQTQLTFAPYPLDETLIALKNSSKDTKTSDILHAQINKIQLAASLGDSLAEYELGQIYQYGIGVQPDSTEAIRNYELAAGQEDLASMYALGLLYLEGSDTLKPDYSKGMEWLNQAAFKGNAYAQFALAQLYEQGLKNAKGEFVIRPNVEKAEGMYYLAAADHHGMAQYHLAEKLVRKNQDAESLAAKQSRQALIKSLYEGAIANGVQEAALPLAFFNAMDTDKTKQKNAFSVAKQEAEQGHANAALLLGLMYDRGIGVEPSKHDALYWYQKSGDSLVSKFVLGTYYSLGTDVTQDIEKGQLLLQESAEANFPYAYLNLAILQQEQGKTFLPQLQKALDLGNAKAGLLLADYYLSLDSDSNQMKQAREIYQKFAEKGDKDAQLKLAYMLEQGFGGKADPQNAFTWYSLSAQQDQPVAQYLLGRLYQLGYLDTMPNYELAKQWYSRAQSSYSPAAVALGFIYDTVDDNYEQAKASYHVASDLHNPIGQYNLGLIYEEGKGLAVDNEKAKALYQQAAELGYAKAMVRLAGLYFNAKDGEGSPQQALSWYKKAAEKEDRDAYYQLGLLTEAGVTTKIDYASALIYYEKAAELGNQQGMLAAARMYQYGIGVSPNKQQAAIYYEKLADLGNAFAQYQLANLYDTKTLTETKLGEGKKWLQEALRNGSPQANQVLQKRALLQQNQLSFIEPILINQMPALSSRPVELMYLDALNQWNCGDEILSKMIFNRIRTQFPNYIPAKRTYERMSLG